MNKPFIILFLLAFNNTFAQFCNVGWSKNDISKDLQSMSKSDPDYNAEIKDNANSLQIEVIRKEVNRKEFDFTYYFKEDQDLAELVCDSAIYKFNCSTCAEKHFGELLKMDRWIKVAPNVYYSKEKLHILMRVENREDAEVCKVITFVKSNWTKEAYRSATKGIKREKPLTHK